MLTDLEFNKISTNALYANPLLNLNINSGDEYAYEYVEHEGTYYVDTQYQRGMLVLPPNPKPGFKLVISDHYGSWIYYPLIVHRNGKKIMGLEEHMQCDDPFSIFSMIYAPETGWDWIVGSDLKVTMNKGNSL